MSEDTKQSQIVDINAQSYYGNNKFAIFIDLRSTEYNQLYGSGKIQLPGDDILLTMTKKNIRAYGIYHMRVYLVSDARLIIKNKKLKSFIFNIFNQLIFVFQKNVKKINYAVNVASLTLLNKDEVGLVA